MEEVDILYEDEQMLAVNKPAGVPVQPDKSKDISLLEITSNQLGSPLFLVHRLDRPVSGVVIFARTKEVSKILSRAFQEREVAKKYWVLTRFQPPKKEDTLYHFIQKNKTGSKAILSTQAGQGKKVVTSYRWVDQSEHLYALELRPETGRFHQIRAQMAAMGCPVRGDVKYGDKRTNRRPGINLHARQITLQHPVKGTVLTIEAPLPDWPEWNAFSIDKP